MTASVCKADANTISFRGSDGGTGDAPVVRPCGEFNARYKLDVFVDGNDLVLAQGLSVWKRGDFSIIKIGQDVSGVEAILFVVYIACAR